MTKKVVKSDEKWKEALTAEEHRLLRMRGTEIAFTGELLNNKRKGTYVCAGCGSPLFSSETKFDSGSGWPSFHKPIPEESVEEKNDKSMFMKRTEVMCEKCGGHLGHVFDDGPAPTGLRYCINSGALQFQGSEEQGKGKEAKKL